MKIYVDGEMPRECWGCPCFRTDIECCCGLDDGTNDYFLDEIDGGECPLQSLAEHDKQSQNSKAIEVLERAKIEFETYYADNIWNYPEWIDNKIKELGGEENG